jgi:hypothetical protein
MARYSGGAVIAASARRRHLRPPEITPGSDTACSSRVANVAELVDGAVIAPPLPCWLPALRMQRRRQGSAHGFAPTNVAATRCAIGRGLAAIRPGVQLDQRYLLHYLRHTAGVWSKARRLPSRSSGSFPAPRTTSWTRVSQVQTSFPIRLRLSAYPKRSSRVSSARQSS